MYVWSPRCECVRRRISFFMIVAVFSLKNNKKKGYQEVQLVACEIYSLVFISGEAQIQ